MLDVTVVYDLVLIIMSAEVLEMALLKCMMSSLTVLQNMDSSRQQ